MTFKVGDVVRLKSGGPRMTVSGMKRSDGLVVCDYFAGNELRNYDGEPEMLVLAWGEAICEDDGFYDDSETDISELTDEELDALVAEDNSYDYRDEIHDPEGYLCSLVGASAYDGSSRG